MRATHLDKRFVCHEQGCDKAFVNAANLKRHQTAMH
jgi:hypothetical protein